MADTAETYKGFYFILVSFLLGLLFYSGFGLLSGYSHTFYDLRLILPFLVLNLAFSLIVYFVSFKSSFAGLTNRDASIAGKTVIIIVSALSLSALFPGLAILGVYPLTMAGPHMLILFFCSLSLSAVILGGMVILWRSGLKMSFRDKTVFLTGALISLGVAYMSMTLLDIIRAG